MSASIKPLMFGYQVVRLGTTDDEITSGRDILQQYATREGYALAEIFVDQDPNHPCAAMTAMIAAVQRIGAVRAIGVPTLEDLGRYRVTQRVTQERLEREAGVPVHVVANQLRAGWVR